MDVYQFEDYKSFILSTIEKNSSNRAYRSAMAKAAGCGRSFFSQALNSHVQLTPDHGAGLCEFWGFDDDRTDYFLDLINLERAAGAALKRRIQRRLNKLRAESKRLSSRKVEETPLSAGLREAVYYSAWHTAAIHTLTAIPGYRTTVAIARRLELSTALVERVLNDLQAIGLVQRKGGFWDVKGMSVHLPKESPLSIINQTNWRNQAIKHLIRTPHDGIHYTAIMALSRKDADEIMGILNKVIDEVIKVVGPSAEEELVCLNVDYFPV